MSEKVYTIEEIKEMIYDILKKYGIEKAYIFGSQLLHMKEYCEQIEKTLSH